MIYCALFHNVQSPFIQLIEIINIHMQTNFGLVYYNTSSDLALINYINLPYIVALNAKF
jgi:hypothetical protein